MDSVLTIGLSPAFERVLVFSSLKEGEVNRAKENYLYASGKALNVTRVLHSYKRPAVNITHLSLSRKDEFLALAEKEGLPVRYVPSQYPTRICTTLINREKGTSTELVEEAGYVGDGVSESFYSLFEEEIKNHKAVIISGTRAKGFDDSLIPRIVEECSKRKLLTVLDVKGEDLINSLEYRPTLIKPNLVEFASTFLGENNLNEGDDNIRLMEKVKDKMKELYDSYNTMSVISRGKYPVLSYDGDSFFETEVPDVKAQNTIGCGDTLTAALTHFLLSGCSLETAVGEAVKRASEKAEKETFL